MLCVLVVVDTQLKALIKIAFSWIKSAMAQIAPFLLYPMTALIRFNADRQLDRNDHPSELDAQRSLSTMRYA